MSIQAIKAIDGIRFSVWSPTEIRKYSVAEITAPETYDEDGMPVQGGLMDGRLGTLEPGQKCLTCGNTAARCPGHFGHIELAEPILHIAFIDNIYKLLQSTCRSCARLKVPQEDLNAFQKIKDNINNYFCYGCGFQSNSLMREGEEIMDDQMSVLPELYKDLKFKDKNGMVWFPSTTNLSNEGMVFANGSSVKNWKWSAVKAIKIPKTILN